MNDLYAGIRISSGNDPVYGAKNRLDPTVGKAMEARMRQKAKGMEANCSRPKDAQPRGHLEFY